MIYLLAFGWGLGESVAVAGGYIAYLAKGMLAITVMMNAVQQTALSVSAARFYYRTFAVLRLSPIHDGAIVLGIALAGTVRALMAATVLGTMTMGNCVAAAEAAGDSIQTRDVVVTASRTEQQVKEAPAAVEVITREDIENTGAETLAQALEMATGINVLENGMVGNQSSIRGMNTNQTLILVDGRRVRTENTSETQNYYELQRVNMDEVERVEIVRGAVSSLYGADALGGVINIITKKTGKSGWFCFRGLDFTSAGYRIPCRVSTGLKYSGKDYLGEYEAQAYYTYFDKDQRTRSRMTNALNSFDDMTFNSYVADGRRTFNLDDRNTLTVGGEYRQEDYESTRIKNGSARTITREGISSISIRSWGMCRELVWSPTANMKMLIRQRYRAWSLKGNRSLAAISRCVARIPISMPAMIKVASF